MMIRFVSLAIASMLAVVGVAVASHKGAKTYKADLEPVTVGDTAPTGKAKLLEPEETYPWHVHEGGTCEPAGDIVTVFEPYGELTANAAGNASAKAKSERFNSEDGYSVNVHDPTTGAPIACGVLERKDPQGEAKGHNK